VAGRGQSDPEADVLDKLAAEVTGAADLPQSLRLPSLS